MGTKRLLVVGTVALCAAGTFGWAETRSPRAYPMPTRIVTEMSGDQVPGSVASPSIGKVYFDVRGPGVLHYKVDVTNLNGVTGVYVQDGAFGHNGPRIASLFRSEEPTGLVRGTLIEGDVTDADLAGSLEGQSVQSLIDRLMASDVYINVTTSKWPTGELRGYIPYPYH
jgi:hypothetical protein